MSELNSHPIHGSRNKCINCGHEIYYLNDHWEHNTRYYKAHGFPFTTKTCYAKGDVPYGGYTYLEDGSMVRPTCCGCEAPEPKYPNDGLTIIISLPETASIDSDTKRKGEQNA